ncbi:MAG: hypothetical protein V7767_07655 [Leeuwenhoekiella sp.]
MKIVCMKTGGFMGSQLSCVIELDELSPVEKDGFEAVQEKSLKDDKMRDSYVYKFEFPDKNKEDEIEIDETLVTDRMVPFINKVDSKLK